MRLELHRGEWRRETDRHGDVVEDRHDPHRWPRVELGHLLIVSPWDTTAPEVALVSVVRVTEADYLLALVSGELPSGACDVVTWRADRPALARD